MRAASRAPWQSICPDRPEPRDRWLTRTEAAALRGHLRTPGSVISAPVHFAWALYRSEKGSDFSLRWPQIELDNARIDFNSPGRRRTRERRARIPIPNKILFRISGGLGFVELLGFVLNDNGVRIRDIKTRVHIRVPPAGLEVVTPDVLRHTCATWLMQGGVRFGRRPGSWG